MENKKICIIAQFPPPVHGLSKAVETLYKSDISKNYNLEKVDITNNYKILKNIFRIWSSKADLFYFTISQTRVGNIRDLIILKLLTLKKAKCLVHLHGGYYRNLIDYNISGIQRKLNYDLIKKLDGVIVLSPSLKAIFQGMIDEKKIYVVPNCVDDEFLISDEEFEGKVNLYDSKEVLHVLYLSNFIKSKGYQVALEMARLEKERVNKGDRKRFHFNFAGKFFEDTEQKYFECYIKENGLEDFITYHGIVGGIEKKKLLEQCDIFMLLTRYPNEGQPISILEAMGNGMFIITTDHAGIPDIAKDGVNGIVVTKNNEDTQIIFKALLESQNKIPSIGRVNRIECVANFSESRYIRNLNDIIRITLSKEERD
jgi:glycosyltransferase involved in cell wall biosynthesis